MIVEHDIVHVVAARPTLRSMLRGALGRCPACGERTLFRGYLTVSEACSACGEQFSHHRADDAPPYFTMLIVGHVVVGLLLWAEIAYSPPLWLHLAIAGPLRSASRWGCCGRSRPPLSGFNGRCACTVSATARTICMMAA